MSGTFTGETPNWVAGYVPPAGEWNQWWSRKVDTDNFVFDGAPFLSLAGGQMTGALLLPPTDPIAPDEAVRKAYVDSLMFAAGPFMPASGGTFSGPVTFTSSATLSGNPLNPLDAAPKQYVDSATNQANNALTVASAAGAACRRHDDRFAHAVVRSGRCQQRGNQELRRSQSGEDRRHDDRPADRQQRHGGERTVL